MSAGMGEAERVRKGGGRLPIPRRRWFVLAGIVVLVALVAADLNSTLAIEWYRVVDPRTIVITVGAAPRSWTRVTQVTETATEVRIKVESFVLPQLGPSTARLALVELTVRLATDLDGRVVTDAHGDVVRLEVPAPPAPTPTPPPSGGISRERAIELATAHSSARTFVTAEPGRFGDLATVGPGSAIAADRWVWAVTFAGEVTVCPPVAESSIGATPAPDACSSPSLGKTTVTLDYFTGEFLSAESTSAHVSTDGPAASVSP